MLSTVDIHRVYRTLIFCFFAIAVNRNISMTTADLISIMVGLGAPVLCVGSRVQRLGYVAAVWRRDAVDAGHH